MATYAADQALRRIALLLPKTAYGELMFTAFKNKCDTLGLECIHHAFYDPNNKDFNAALDILAQKERATEELASEKALLDTEYKLLGEAMDDVSLTRYYDIQTAEPEPIVEFDALFVPGSADVMPLLALNLHTMTWIVAKLRCLVVVNGKILRSSKNRAEYIRGGLIPCSRLAYSLWRRPLKKHMVIRHTRLLFLRMMPFYLLIKHNCAVGSHPSKI